MDSVTVVTLTCDRPELFEAAESITKHLHAPVLHKLCLVDGADPDRLEIIRAQLGPSWGVLSLSDEVSGFGPSMQRLAAVCGALKTPWLWLHEDDFRLDRDIELADLAQIMDAHPELVQMNIKRQPWWPHELEADSVFFNDQFIERNGYVESPPFTTNPSLIRTQLFRDHPWPSGEWSERSYGEALVKLGYKCGTLGKLADPPLVTHLGGERTNVGY